MSQKKKYNEVSEDIRIVNEAATAYGSESPYSILRVASKQSESRLSTFDKMKVVRDGITKKDLESLKLKTKMDYPTLAKALSVTRATLINKKGNEKFGSSISEKILDIADLYSFGFEVFEDESRFRDWMNTPNRALDFKKPSEFLDNQFGREEVRNLIGRIAYGVYS